MTTRSEPGSGAASPSADDALFTRVEAAAETLASVLGARAARVAVILGSGLSVGTDELAHSRSLSFADIAGFPRPTVAGHAGRVVVGHVVNGGDARVAAPSTPPVLFFAGRIHGYEGRAPAEVTFAVRVAAALGVRTLIVTNAAGGIDPTFFPGQIVALSDHLNLTGASPLTGPNDARWGPRFPDMSEAYARPLRALAAEEARRTLGYELREGVYAGVAGPAYETPAEIRMLATLGAQLVGMSTVHEVIAARHAGLEVLGLSIVSNAAAGVRPRGADANAEVGDTPRPLRHEDVTRAAADAAAGLMRLIFAVVARLPPSSPSPPSSPVDAGRA